MACLHLHNDVIHVKGEATIEGSVRFLQSCTESLLQVRQKPVVDVKDKRSTGIYAMCEERDVRGTEEMGQTEHRYIF